MQNLNQLSRKKAGLLGTIFGSLLIGLPAIPLAATAQSSVLNPCPRIFYEEPHNNRVLVPQGCPPNAATLRFRGQGQVGGVQPNILVQPDGLPVNRQPIPFPESRQNPIAYVQPMAGKVSVRLNNDTNTRVTYQAIGYTQQRFLSGGEEAFLQNLPTPVTITFTREDNGLVKVIPIRAAEAGTLAVTLDEEPRLDDNQGVLRIQSDGQVFLN